MGVIILPFNYKKGLHIHLPENKLVVIDSKIVTIPPNAQTIVSHAHSDHYAAFNSHTKTYATKPTIELFTTLNKTITEDTYQEMPFHQPKILHQKDTEISLNLIPSGHILGSASVIINNDGQKILFSSDIGGDGLISISNKLETPQADILIIEATFGSKDIIFPQREVISMDILKWAASVAKQKMNSVFFAGQIGSAQELVKIFNSMSNLRVITHGKITAICDIYQKNGISLDYIDSRSVEGREILKDGEAVIIMSRGKKIVPYFMKEHRNCKQAIATGMAAKFQFRNYDAAFPLSSHANYRDLLKYVNTVNPKEVYTIFGYDKKFAKTISKEFGIPAEPLKSKILKDFTNTRTKYQTLKTTYEANTLSSKEKIKKNTLPTKLKNKKNLTLDDYFNLNN
ncbi:MAG: MBL fold metallo-hydrolase [Asgard group archaeon]|nr:MBL fold metallo-hydrolase [Asgard group archaeon]